MEDRDFKDWVAELRDKCDLYSIMSKYCTFVVKGRKYWTCCPFHIEKTPSLCIYDLEQVYHCFGCKEHGDVIKFVMKIESCDYMQAIEILARYAGMQIPDFKYKNEFGIEKTKKEKDTILQLLHDAKEHYKENLYHNVAKPAQDYIKKRKLTRSELEDFEFGYSIDYKEMLNFLKQKKYSYELIKKAGIADVLDNGNYYDIYAKRLVFPLFNVYNECVGFSARILENDKSKAKYKNSPNTIVFDKSKFVYGLNLVRKLKQKQQVNNVIIVEGQMDVIAMHKSGFKNTVACLGTAFTSYHAKMLKLISDNAIICMDGDSAGQNATLKVIDVLINEGFNVKAIKLPNNNDPDEYIQNNGIDAMQKQIDNAKDYIIYLIDYYAENVDFSKSEEKGKFARNVMQVLDKLGSDSEKQIYLKHIKELSGIPVDVLRQDLFKRNVFAVDTKIEEKPEVRNIEDGTNKAIKFILASMIYKKDYINYNFNLKKYLHNDTYVKLYDLVIEKMKNNQHFTVSSLYDDFNFDEEPNLVDIINYNFEDSGNNKKYYEECLWNIVEKELKQKQSELNAKFLATKDNVERKNILMEISEIAKKLKNKNVED